MRSFSETFQAKLDSGVTTLCRAWEVRRRDGTVLGFTDHDRDLEFGAVRFEAAAGLTAGAVEAVTGLAVDTAAAAGAVRSDAIREDDIAAGRYDGAEVTGYVVDWQRPEDRYISFFGTIGEVTRGTLAFEAELLSLSDQLNRPIGRAVLRRCDAVLGDGRCKVDLDQPAFRGTGAVTEVDEGTGRLTVSGLDGFAGAWFEQGAITWTSGANAGLTGSVKRDLDGAARRLELWVPMPNPVAAGDGFEIRAGCDKSPETCAARFANFLNFQGFPHVPGEDWGLAYPKEGEVHNGGSLFGR